MQLFVFHEIENGNKDKLNGAKVEGQVRFGKDAAEFMLVYVREVKDFDKLGNQTAVKEDGNEGAEAFLSNKQEKSNDKQNGNAYQNEMFCAK